MIVGSQQTTTEESESSAETIRGLQRIVENLQRELDEVTLYAAQLRAQANSKGSVYDLRGSLRRLRHERGWSQSQVVNKIEAIAEQRRIWLPARGTMRIYLSRWENGHARPSGVYQELLDAVFAHSARKAANVGC